MSDTSKPPERVWIKPVRDWRKVHNPTVFDDDLDTIYSTTKDWADAHAYIHEDPLPGTVEEIRELVAAVRVYFDPNFPKAAAVARMGSALAAMKPEEQP